MKYSLFAFALLMAFSCGEKHKEASEDVKWKEMDDFHSIMADVYHPLKDSNNLEPIKKQADELAASATKWAEAPLPEKVDNEETKELLSKLEDGTKQLAEAVKNGDTEGAISTKLTMLHDTFHSIMESWYQAGKEEGSENITIIINGG